MSLNSETMTDPVDLSGFAGWVTFSRLPDADVPTGSGVYVVVRPSTEPPSFLDVSPAGHFKGIDPTVAIAELAALWGARWANRLHRQGECWCERQARFA
jgi:hypothetical protein